MCDYCGILCNSCQDNYLFMALMHSLNKHVSRFEFVIERNLNTVKGVDIFNSVNEFNHILHIYGEQTPTRLSDSSHIFKTITSKRSK